MALTYAASSNIERFFPLFNNLSYTGNLFLRFTNYSIPNNLWVIRQGRCRVGLLYWLLRSSAASVLGQTSDPKQSHDAIRDISPIQA